MAREPIRWINVVLMWVCIAIGFVSAYAISIYPFRILVDKDAGQIWPAWVQAGGSIVAILVAVAVPAWQRIQQRSDAAAREDRQARSLASDLLADVSQFYDLTGYYRSDLEHAIKRGDDHLRGPLHIPKHLNSSRRDLHVLGAPGDCLLHALYFTALLNDIAQFTRGVLPEELEEAEELLDSIQDDLYDAIEGMKELLD